jgi:hypothetical protein
MRLPSGMGGAHVPPAATSLKSTPMNRLWIAADRNHALPTLFRTPVILPGR